MDLVRDAGHAVSARYDRRRSRVVIALSTGVELAFPTRLAEGLAGASPENLADIEISPAGLGLHWPRLDADLYVPALLQGVFGSKSWMARQLGAEGGRARTVAKVWDTICSATTWAGTGLRWSGASSISVFTRRAIGRDGGTVYGIRCWNLSPHEPRLTAHGNYLSERA